MREKNLYQPGKSYEHRLNRDHDVTFVNLTEWAFAEMLDITGVMWEYEHTDFLLQVNEDNTPHMRFVPDFFLPEHNMYVEITRNEKQMDLKRTKVALLKEVEPHYRTVIVGPDELKEIFQRDGNRVFTPESLINWLTDLYAEQTTAQAK